VIAAILFDLDGTLLGFRQDAFINAYFTELGKAFARMGFDAKEAIAAVWAGTKAMVRNDGTRPNADRFWATFAGEMNLSGERLRAVENACDSFYQKEFDAVKSVLAPNDLPGRMIRDLRRRGHVLALATNPLFPACAVATRLNWIGLRPDDFQLVTDYKNSVYCKPNPHYYASVFKALNQPPERCLMVGNNAAEDMVAGTLGAQTFLVTDYLEQDGEGCPPDRQGTLQELYEYLGGL
jgi:FMN phosphatase YigB (HAD superfamily)